MLVIMVRMWYQLDTFHDPHNLALAQKSHVGQKLE